MIELAKQLGVPVQAVLLAAHYKVLSAVSGFNRTVSCVTHNGRPEIAGAERSLGLYLNSLPMSVEVGPGSWRELVQQISEISTRSMEYRGYPLSQIQQDVEWTFSEVLFNYTHFHVYNELTTSTSDKGKLEALSSSGFEQTNFDLVVSVSRRLTDGTMSLILVYNAIVFDGDLMYRMGGYYASAFEQMLEAPERPHDAQSLLGEKEQRQILIEWNQTAVSYAEDLCMHQLFEIQAAKTPRSAAVEYEGQRLSYAELESKANRLAHYLMRRGVGPEVRVAICMGRSLDMIVGLLGILKAGGAYVPLDPSYPADRLNFMLEDAEVNLILTQEQMLGKLGTDGKFGKAPAVVCLDRQWQEIARGAGRAGRHAQSVLTILPTFITPPGPPAGPRVSAYRIKASRTTFVGQSTLTERRKAMERQCIPRSRST